MFAFFVAFAFCVVGSAASFSMMGVASTSVVSGAVMGTGGSLGAGKAIFSVDRAQDGDEVAPDVMVAPAVVEEEEREDDPVPGAEHKLVELSERMGRLLAWDRPDFARPVKDPVAETASPPPRA